MEGSVSGKAKTKGASVTDVSVHFLYLCYFERIVCLTLRNNVSYSQGASEPPINCNKSQRHAVRQFDFAVNRKESPKLCCEFHFVALCCWAVLHFLLLPSGSWHCVHCAGWVLAFWKKMFLSCPWSNLKDLEKKWMQYVNFKMWRLHVRAQKIATARSMRLVPTPI